ncbi:murein L,D-transpeptidase [Streptomyces sp. NBC_00439]|uniref:L,D-transpeptidase family protein n=1 Tax=Streptomyces sp. NBC_00439 TaxID=2903650 RepID=UPI00224FD714|nr:murein L,D-transpeptidase [Streptomyces sp. NBC_00439]MCX5106996.1 L,D-transpeptidase family protein [Streptomyces sp. NBC_00439]
MNRSTFWATLTTTALAIAAFATLGTQAPDTASANSSSDPAASAARSAAPASRIQQQWPTLRTGAQGSAVTTLQQLLTAQGHPLTADGEFGPLTEAAVRAFQAQHSLQADGVVGPKTWNALRSTPTKPSPRPGPSTYTLKLTKNWNNPLNSRLALVKDGKELKSYRAGSGGGSTDECVPNTGWVPSGVYKIKGHFTNRGNWNPRVAVQGYAMQLEDKYCKPAPGQKPVKRTEMFIHSEMLTNGGQAPDNWFEKDDTWHWNGPSDYSSLGCIKLEPTDIKDLFSRLDQAGWPKNLTLQVS